MNDYKKLLARFIGFKTVSTDPKFKGEIEKCVSWLTDLFEKNKFKVEVWRGKNNPVIFASFELATSLQSLETILIYGHYDVQPADNFKLIEKDGWFYGRGVADNKGQTLIHMVTAFELIKEKNLGYNIKFLLEGDEESAGDELETQIKDKRQEIKANLVLISDGEIDGENPCLEISLRGGFNVTLKFKTGETDLHSGTFGKKIYNAAHELVKFLAKLEVGSTEKLMPTIQITGIKSGYVGQGYANIIPAASEARLNFRLVAEQDPHKVFEDFKKYVKKMVPKGVEYEINVQGMHPPVQLKTDGPKVKMIKKILKQVYGGEVLHKHEGGAIPVVGIFQKILKTEVVLVPLANEDCNMHGANENFRIDLIEKGLKFSRLLLQK